MKFGVGQAVRRTGGIGPVRNPMMAALAVISSIACDFGQIHGATAAGAAKDLYDFCCQRNFSNAGLLLDPSGNLYGTNEYDGTFGKGTAFKLSFNSQTGSWTYTALHVFCSEANCTDGAYPRGGLIIDTAGNIYGTAEGGGNTGYGVAFEVTRSGKYKPLYSFCADGKTCSDGAYPIGTLTYAGAATGAAWDGSSPLYGAGSTSGGGLVFELSPGGKSRWSSSTAYVLGSEDANACDPDIVSMDASGNLIGTTEWCGMANVGMAFKLTNGDQGWTEAARLDFDANYRNPRGAVVEDNRGRLYGVAEFGGKYGVGSIYRLTPQGDTFAAETLYVFNEKSGSHPQGGLFMDQSGHLYGSATGGGKGEGGTVFELTRKGFTLLYGFCRRGNCPDGSDLLAGVVRDNSGNIYGISTLGGANDYGTVFELSDGAQ